MPWVSSFGVNGRCGSRGDEYSIDPSGRVVMVMRACLVWTFASMGLLNKKVFTAEVDFFGVKEWEQSDGDPPNLYSAVRSDPHSTVAQGRSAFGLMVPLVAAKLLYNSKAERRITTPMMDALETAAVVLGDLDEDPRSFSFREGDFEDVSLQALLAAGPDDDALLAAVEDGEHFERMLFALVPQLDGEARGGADCTFHASLMRGRGGWWVKVKAPWKGPAFFAMFGLFAMIERLARSERDRATALDPAMCGLRALCHLYFEVLRGHGFDSMRTLTAFNTVISDVVLADDPAAALDDVEGSFEPLDVDPTPDVAAREARDAAYRHEFNARLTDSPATDETAEQIRQEAKRLRAGREVPVSLSPYAPGARRQLQIHSARTRWMMT